MPDVLRKFFMADLQVRDGERAVVATITTSTIDRDGEVLIPQGCDASEFQRNPAVFYAHDYAQPVGKCTAIRRLENAIEAKTTFAQRPADHVGPWLPDTLLSLFQQGVLRGFSVGFLPIESRRPTRRDHERFGQNVERVHSKWKLLEYSVAPLPANPEALATAVSKGIITPEAAQQFEARAQTNDDAPPQPRKRRMAMLLLPAKSASRIPATAQVVRREWARARGRFAI